ncbi:hypothetical protein [Aquimarina sp. 2201CG14-23]|uniref:hypothetical protein n=1 Tax=Aquimarina mycalae TaxID=3040073 RepID=UPI002477E984|nr:hypothetical protein [Aquimarina sp. 2201CG14-23]MDH7444126.1 hypothetical protein [Aquimarina sp. 2201CG14-23]
MFREVNKHTTNAKIDQQHLFQKREGATSFIQPKLNIQESGNTNKQVVTDKFMEKQSNENSMFSSSSVIQKQPIEGVQKKEDDEWHTDTFSGNNYMSYEIQVIFQNLDKNAAYVIPEEHKDVFDEWKNILIGQKNNLNNKEGKEQIVNIYKLIIAAIRNGKFPKKMMKTIKKGDVVFKAASDWNKDAEKSCQTISEDDLIAIFKEGDLFKQLETNEQGRACTMIENNQCLKNKDEYLKFLKDKKIVGRINEAFRIMGIDTIKSQAVYLAHSAGESNNLMSLTETKNKWMDKYRGGEKYRGRGAFHTTHKDGYIKVLAYMDALLSNDAIPEKDKEKIKKASSAIKKDVTKASDPEFTFIFSAAYMHMAGGVAKSGNVSESPSFLGTGPESSWVAGQNINELKEKEKFKGRAKLKAEVYKSAINILNKKKCSTE